MYHLFIAIQSVETRKHSWIVSTSSKIVKQKLHVYFSRFTDVIIKSRYKWLFPLAEIFSFKKPNFKTLGHGAPTNLDI